MSRISRVTRYAAPANWKRSGSKPEAIALRYDAQKGGAPQVVAKGRGATAAAIVETAHQHDVPVVRDPIALEALKSVDIGDQIPTPMYRLVAEVLAFVYNLGERPKRRP